MATTKIWLALFCFGSMAHECYPAFYKRYTGMGGLALR